MHLATDTGFEPAVIPELPVPAAPGANEVCAKLAIAIHLQGTGDKGSAADKIVIDQFPFVLARRHDCDHTLDNPCVSRRHCSILLKRGGVAAEEAMAVPINVEDIGLPQSFR